MICSDPYNLGCMNEASGSMLGNIYDRYLYTYREIMIYLCNSCCWWNCDWDWNDSPEGPFLHKIG